MDSCLKLSRNHQSHYKLNLVNPQLFRTLQENKHFIRFYPNFILWEILWKSYVLKCVKSTIDCQSQNWYHKRFNSFSLSRWCFLNFNILCSSNDLSRSRTIFSVRIKIDHPINLSRPSASQKTFVINPFATSHTMYLFHCAYFFTQSSITLRSWSSFSDFQRNTRKAPSAIKQTWI